MAKYCEHCSRVLDDDSLTLCDSCIIQGYEEYIDELERTHDEMIDAEIELREAQYSRGF